MTQTSYYVVYGISNLVDRRIRSVGRILILCPGLLGIQSLIQLQSFGLCMAYDVIAFHRKSLMVNVIFLLED